MCYNSSYVEGAGLTYGDLIEHLWADIRKHWSMTAYMSPAMRQDYIRGLVGGSAAFPQSHWVGPDMVLCVYVQVRLRHQKKEEGLAAQLIAWAKRALSLRQELTTRYVWQRPHCRGLTDYPTIYLILHEHGVLLRTQTGAAGPCTSSARAAISKPA